MSFQPGTLDEHIVRYPTLRMEEEKRKKLNEEFALLLMTENRPNNSPSGCFHQEELSPVERQTSHLSCRNR